ncbi:MAG: hypothetical protein ACYC1S_02190 [Gemmatimonadaceae bacterium]
MADPLPPGLADASAHAAGGAPAARAPRARRLMLALQLVAGALVVVFAGRALIGYWRDFRQHPLQVEPSWPWILGSGLVFLATYAVLIESWRRALSAWDAALPFVDGARIWTVSSLGRYVPGKLWQVGAMGVMAQRRGVSPIAATGSAVLNTLVNVVVGLVIVLATGGVLAERVVPGAARWSMALLGMGILVIVTLPLMMPRLVALAERLTGRSLGGGHLPVRAVVVTVAGNALAWALYGLAFQLLARGVLGHAPGSITAWIAVYALSYLFGYIMLFAPAGVGFRELAMVAVMPAAGLATAGEAAVLAAASRIWLTVLEVVPGLLFLLRDTVRRHQSRNGPT